MTLSELSKALEPVVTELRRIADALEAFVPEPEQPAVEPTCPHPEDSRFLIGSGPMFLCQVCQQTVTPL
jgi:hypothetical protein